MRESMSGVIYKGIEWKNYCDNPDRYLISVYDVEGEIND